MFPIDFRLRALARLALTLNDSGNWPPPEPVLAKLRLLAITSDFVFSYDEAPDNAFRLEDVKGIAVVVGKAEDSGLIRCARSWRYTADVGSNAEFPDVSARDAAVLRELQTLGRL